MCECCAPRPKAYGVLRNIAECKVRTAFPVYDGMRVEIISRDDVKNGISWTTVRFEKRSLCYSFPKQFIEPFDAEAAA